MTARDVLHLVGALALLIYGIASLLAPHRIALFIAQILDSSRGVAEFRILNGGFMIGLSLAALLANQPVGYAVLGIGWLGAAASRLIAMVVDRPPLNASFFAYLVAEVVLGMFLLA